jgi:hypothetical protein
MGIAAVGCMSHQSSAGGRGRDKRVLYWRPQTPEVSEMRKDNFVLCKYKPESIIIVCAAQVTDFQIIIRIAAIINIEGLTL